MKRPTSSRARRRACLRQRELRRRRRARDQRNVHVVPLENAAALELPHERDAVDHVVAAEWVAMST